MSIDLVVGIPAMDQQWQVESTGKGAFAALNVRIAHTRRKDIYVEKEATLDSF
jgi:hypothetical protein